MAMRFVSVACVLMVVLAITAAVFSMINVGRFDLPSAGKALGLVSLAALLWSSARRRYSKPPAPPRPQENSR
jgi:hypothetical protein